MKTLALLTVTLTLAGCLSFFKDHEDHASIAPAMSTCLSERKKLLEQDPVADGFCLIACNQIHVQSLRLHGPQYLHESKVRIESVPA